jgi:hypothetical protein
MRLAAESRLLIEQFFRAQFGDPQVELPPIKVYGNALINYFLRWQRVGAITFGSCVFVDSAYFARDTNGRMMMPGWLMAHEATHVLQFARDGWVKFLTAYLRDYVRELFAQQSGVRRAEARVNAYRAIAAERQAHEMEKRFKEWAQAAKTS